MPYPHKNSDGKATLGHDENGMPRMPKGLPWNYSPNHPVFAHKDIPYGDIQKFHANMEAGIKFIKAQMEKDLLTWKQVQEKHLLPMPGDFGKPAPVPVKKEGKK